MRASLVFCVVFVVVSGCECDPVVVTPPGGVVGPICNPLNGEPAPNAHVKAVNTAQELVKEGDTDGDGDLELLGLPPDSYTLRVETESFRRELAVDIQSSTNTPLDDTACRPLPPAPGHGFVAGSFCAVHTGGTVANAAVRVTLSDGTVIESTTDENGEMRVEVPTGSVTVTVEGSGVRKQYAVEVVDGDTVIVEQDICAPPPFASTNHITGDVCLQDGVDLSTATALARWRLDSTETEVTGTVDADGHFDVDGIAPTPLSDVYVEINVGALRRSWTIPLVPSRNQVDGVSVNDLDVVGDDDDDGCTPLLPDDGLRYLVVEGIFDSIESVLFRMSLPNVELIDGRSGPWAERLLTARENLESYDAVFVNCGVDESEWTAPGGLSIAARTNLRDYVEAGGALYVSDLAYDLIEQVFPDAIDFFGDDTLPSVAELSEGGAYDAAVVDADLAAELGVDAFALDFNFGLGAVVDSVADDVDVLLTTDLRLVTDPEDEQLVLDDTPISMAFDRGLGRVVFSSFHQEVIEGEAEGVDGPEDAMLQHLVFQLDR